MVCNAPIYKKVESMSQHSGVNTNLIHNSTETLNFQLAVPNTTLSTPPDTMMAENELKNTDPEKTYLETEIDSYSGVEFMNKRSFSSSVRPPTPPKPTMRAFTFGTTNPFLVSSNQTTPSNAFYTTVNKPKIRPKVPPKPSPIDIQAKTTDVKNSVRSSTTSLYNTTMESTADSVTAASYVNVIQRVSSLPNLGPNQLVQVGDSLQPVTGIRCRSTEGYGMINQLNENASSHRPLRIVTGSSKDVDYCDMIPESPPYINELPNDSENVYEDVKIANASPSLVPSQQQKPSHNTVSDRINKKQDDEYTEMISPISDVRFTFQSSLIYENLPAHLPNSRVGVYEGDDFDASEVLEPPLEFSSDSSDFSIIPDSNRPPERHEYNTSHSPHYTNTDAILHGQQPEISPSSSFTGRSSSVASTVASSFQGVQVCYFPPQPPSEFYGDINTCGLPTTSTEMTPRSGSVSTASSSTFPRRSSSRLSRSRIPVPATSPRIPENYSSLGHITVPEEPAPPIPPTPSPSPVQISKNKKKGNKQEIKLSPPSPPSGKGARWYEKLGCIQSDTINPAEPYGAPGERKRSKSLSKENRRSKFFVPILPNEIPAPQGNSTPTDHN